MKGCIFHCCHLWISDTSLFSLPKQAYMATLQGASRAPVLDGVNPWRLRGSRGILLCSHALKLINYWVIHLSMVQVTTVDSLASKPVSLSNSMNVFPLENHNLYTRAQGCIHRASFLPSLQLSLRGFFLDTVREKLSSTQIMQITSAFCTALCNCPSKPGEKTDSQRRQVTWESEH